MNEKLYQEYNLRDCIRTFEIDQEELARGAKRHLKQLSVIEFQNSLIQPTMRMTRRGIKIDLTVRDRLIADTDTRMKESYQWIESAIGHGINIDSPAQMKTLFYTDLGQKEVKIRNGSKWTVSCGKEAFPKIVEREPLLRPLVDKINGIRTEKKDLDKLRSNLMPGGRICTVYNIPGTKTYRFAHTDTEFGIGTNLGNVNHRIKEMMVPDEGHTIFDIDLKSADLSIVAWESGCQELKDMLNAGISVYVELAKEYYHDPNFKKLGADGQENPLYRIFKSLCHGTNYLGQSQGLSSRTGLRVEEVERLQRWYFGRFPDIKQWHASVIEQIESGWVENIFGHRCYFLGRTSNEIYREGVAWIPQSTVARIIDTGLVRVDKLQCDNPTGFPVLLLNQVHDSLVGQYPTDMAEILEPKILDLCAVELDYPDKLTIPVELHTSTISWAHCK